MSIPQLTVGICHALQHGIEPVPDHLKAPIVQVIDVKKITANSNQPASGDRYRLVISDGVHFIQAMLTTQLNPLIKSGNIQNKSIIRVTDFICNTVHDKRIAIILNLEVVAPPTATNIGSPVASETTKATDIPSASAVRIPVAAPKQAPRQNQPVPRPQVPPKQQSQSVDLSGASLTEIRALNPYLPKWTIRARVTNKSDLRGYNNAKGSGKLFSIDLVDESGEIRATMFNETADHFYPQFVVGDVYMISKGTLKFANKKFSSLNNDFELNLDANSIVQRIDDASVGAAMPKMHYKFVPVADVQDRPKDDIVDVIGVIMDVKAFSTITTRAGSQLAKREVDIADDSNRGIQITLWGERAEHFSGDRNGILALKGAKVAEYGGNKSLSALQSTVIELNPDNDRAIQLRSWIDHQDPNALQNLMPSSDRGEGGAGRAYNERYLQEISNAVIVGKAEYLTVKATVMNIKTDKTLFYQSCSGNNCMRKVSGDEASGYHCDKCNKSYDRCNMRYVLNLSISDHTANQWVSAFNDAAKVIMNVDANELAYRRANEPTRFESIVEAARYNTFLFRASLSAEDYEGQSRTRMKLLSAHPIDFVSESRKLVAKIQALQGQTV